MDIPDRLSRIVKQLQADLDHAAESGARDNRVSVDFDDLNALLSWLAGDPA